MTRSVRGATLVALLAAACSGGGSRPPGGAPDAGDSSRASAVIGPAGGTLELAGGPRLDVPAGALTAPTTVAIEATGSAGPGGQPVYRIAPDGLALAAPATVTFPASAGSAASVYWSVAGDASHYDALPTTPAGAGVEAYVTRLAQGFVGPYCLSGAACVPADCRVGAVSCSATAGAPLCADAGRAAVEGAACGAGGVCTAGACGAPQAPTRTVAATSRIVFHPDDGSETVAAGPPPSDVGAPVALLVPTSAGYATFPVQADAAHAFSVSGVPRGRYFLEFDSTVFVSQAGVGTIPATLRTLFELSADAPDLSWVSAARPDLARASGAATPVTLDVSGLAPWETLDRLIVLSSQADYREFPLLARSSPAPAAGATSWTGTFDWSVANSTLDPPGLPDAAKRDGAYVYQRKRRAVGADGSIWDTAAAAAPVTGFTLADGGAATLTAALAPPSTSTSIPATVRASRWAALAPAVHPGASPSKTGLGGIGVIGVPGSVSYPDMPYFSLAPVASLTIGDASVDRDYGALAYGAFLDSRWVEMVNAVFGFEGTDFDAISLGIGSFPVASASSEVARSDVVGPPVPRITPPAAPLVAGKDAFAFRTGVGTSPLISWSPPAFGAATSYRILVVQVTPLAAPSDVKAVTATLHGTSFQVPDGFMKPGQQYVASIVAVSGAGDALDAPPFRRGLPVHTAGCVTAPFAP